MSERLLRLVVNTSPLIHLAEASLLHLLRETAPTIWVPEPVAREIRAYGNLDPTARALAAHDWLEAQPVSVLDPRRDAWQAHFDLDPNGSIGSRTAAGRATIHLLKLNRPERIEERQMLLPAGLWFQSTSR